LFAAELKVCFLAGGSSSRKNDSTGTWQLLACVSTSV
jgi:hypothetical protein